MTFIIDSYRFDTGGGPGVPWDTYIASLSPWVWLKLDDAPGGTVAADSSGNTRNGNYPNGTFGGGDLYPDRQAVALITGSTYGIISGGGGNDELRGLNYGNAMSGSWALGATMKTTSTTAASRLMGNSTTQGAGLLMGFNHNWATPANQSGTISFKYNTSTTNADALVATGTGWNDGNGHLILFEHDSVADTISIWLDGTEIATRARPGTVPTMTNLTIDILRANPIAGIGMDEVLLFDRVLTSTEHSDLATFVM